MSITQSVTTIFKSKDQTSEKFNRMGKNAKKFGETSSRAFKKASRSATTFGTITKGILTAGLIQKGLGLVTRGLTSVTAGFLDFDQSITSASAKFSDLNLTTKEGQKTLLVLKKTAREVGKLTEFSASQAAAGLDFLALAGFKTKQAMALLPGVVNLATVANVDLATATDIASDSLGAFGLMTQNSAKLAMNFTRVQDVMAKTTATSNTNLIDLFEAVKKGAPDFTAAGQSIETFSTLIGVMANSGIKGAEAGTKLRNMAVRLTGGSKEASKMIKSLGIRVADSSGNFRDMLDIIDDVNKGVSKMGSVQRAAALKVIFGARQTGGLNVILQAGTKRLRSYRQMLIDSSGAAKKMAEIMRSSLINRLKSLGSAALEVGFQFFSAFSEQGAGAIDKLTKFIRKIDLKPMIENIKAVGRGAATLFGIIKDAIPFFIPFVAAYAAWVVTLKAQIALGVAGKIFLMAKAIRAAGVAQWFLNTAMAANPVGAIIAGVVGLVALTVVVIKNWEAIWGWISKIAKVIGSIVGFGALTGQDVITKEDTKKTKAFEKIIPARRMKALTEKEILLRIKSQTLEEKKVIPFRKKELLEKKTIPAQQKPLLEKKTIPFRKKQLTETESFFKKIFDPSGVKKKEPPLERTAPNTTQLESRRVSEFKGKLDITGAPEGSTLKTKSTGPDIIDVELAGASFG